MHNSPPRMRNTLGQHLPETDKKNSHVIDRNAILNNNVDNLKCAFV